MATAAYFSSAALIPAIFKEIEADPDMPKDGDQKAMVVQQYLYRLGEIHKRFPRLLKEIEHCWGFCSIRAFIELCERLVMNREIRKELFHCGVNAAVRFTINEFGTTSAFVAEKLVTHASEGMYVHVETDEERELNDQLLTEGMNHALAVRS